MRGAKKDKHFFFLFILSTTTDVSFIEHSIFIIIKLSPGLHLQRTTGGNNS